MNKLRILHMYIRTKYGLRFRSRERLRKFQHTQVAKHLRFVLEHSPFYKEWYRNHHEDIQEGRWHQLPMIDKRIMMENFDAFNTVGITKKAAFETALEAERTRDFSPTIGTITIGLSSGTSGNRGLFLVSEEERYLWAGSMLAKVLPSGILHTETVAFFLRANSNLYETTNNGRIAFHFFDVLDGGSKHRDRLHAVQPTILIAPPSMLRQIAHWQESGCVSISPVKIISVAEVLEDIDKAYIASVFHQVVHGVYQCTEGFLAATCRYGTLHMNEDLVYIEKEYVDEAAGVFVPIITDFHRKTQPIIRYRLNDLLVERKQPCACGSPFLALERIDGRCDDMFVGRRTNGEDILLFPDLIRRAIMLATGRIEEFQVIQHPDLCVEVKLKLSPDADRELVHRQVQKQLSDVWKQQVCSIPPIFYSEYDIVPSDKKLKRIERITG